MIMHLCSVTCYLKLFVSLQCLSVLLEAVVAEVKSAPWADIVKPEVLLSTYRLFVDNLVKVYAGKDAGTDAGTNAGQGKSKDRSEDRSEDKSRGKSEEKARNRGR